MTTPTPTPHGATERDWSLALQSLTPGGSEFQSPEACEAYVRERLHHGPERMKEVVRLKREISPLRAFAQAILQRFPEEAPDEFKIRALAVAAGLLEGVWVTESCGDDCWCAGYGDFPLTCYRRTELLMGKEGYGR